MSNKNVWIIVVGVVVIVCALALCTTVLAVGTGGFLSSSTPATGTSNVHSARSEGVMRLYAREAVTLDPALAGDANSTEFIDKIFNGLVALNDKMEIVPELAKSWEVSNGGTVYVFHLRDDIKFQDGAPVTAKDFKYTVERVCDPKTGSKVASSYLKDILGALDKLAGQADEVRGVEVVDDRTVRITIDTPKAYFLSELTYHTFFVVDQRNVESGGGNWWQKPNGSGPFKLQSMNKDQIVLAANEHYVGGPPPIAEVRFTLRGGSPMTMYEQGELDAVLVSSTDIERVLDPTNSLNKDLTIVPSLDIWYLAFDNQQKPFDDVKVRQAFAYATNKEGIAKILLQKTVTPAKGILPPGLPGYNEKLQGIPYDPERAKALIADSSYKESKNLPPIVFATSGSGDTDPLAAALTEMYADTLGVDIEIHQVDWAHFQEDLYAHKYQMFMLGWVGDYPDPQDFLDVLFHSKSEQNHAGYKSPEVDKLLEQARSEQDREARIRLYQQVEEIIVNEAPWVPIDHGIAYVLIKPYVKDFSVTPQGEYYLTKARLVSP